jgi:hypothetical protein
LDEGDCDIDEKDDEFIKAPEEEDFEGLPEDDYKFFSFAPDILGDEFLLCDYGLGIEGYLRFLQKICLNMCCFSVAAIILVIIYRTNGDLTGAGMYTPIAQMSLGNLEGATVSCL